MKNRVGLVLENSIVFIEKLLHVWRSGDCAVILDWRIPLKKTEMLLKEANVSQCFIERHLLQEGMQAGICWMPVDSRQVEPLEVPKHIYSLYYESYAKEEAIVLYSSGTTGKEKGIILTHYAIQKNVDFIVEYMKPETHDSILILKTLAHSSTLVGELLVGLKAKCKIWIAPVILSPSNVIRFILQKEISILCVNPTILSLLTSAKKRIKEHIYSLRSLYVSGAIADVHMLREAQASFLKTNILNVYGLTEAGPRVTAQTNDQANNRGSVGKEIGCVEIEIRALDGTKMPKTEKGIVFVKTPCAFLGYVGQSTTNNDMMWFCTGDVGYIDDDGQLHITGRKDNMISIGSHNVYPEEIEELIFLHPDVSDCIVYGEKNKLYGNLLICEYISDKNLDKELKELCRKHLAMYEIPQHFRLVQEIRHTANGKKIRR